MKFEIQNIVAKADLGVKINLNKLASSLEIIEYDPESFPGLTLKLKDPKATFLIFGTGKIVITGCKNVKVMKGACAKVEAMLKKYRMI
jgi:transcription initiation factor TFIID TATA-box-binding protein